jgi:Zn-dependent membrane protease YugP
MFNMGLLIVSLIAMAIMGLASRNVQATFKRFSQVPIRRRMTGAQTARAILDMNGLQNIAVERVSGNLTDHYDPTGKVLRLSQPVYDSMSVSAVGVAAHEAGHALQDKDNYGPLRLRSGIVPLVGVSTNIGMWMIMIGLIMGFSGATSALGIVGLLLYSTGVIFALITLPVEFNASNRALAVLTQNGMVTTEEYNGTQKVLNAAALTYVAAAFGAILQLLYFAWLIFGSRDE